MLKKKSLFKVLSIVLVMILILTCAKMENAYAANRPVVYTKFYANSSSLGTGSKEDPYNLFKDALASVDDGGTIYITGGQGFINVIEKNEGNPFVINKNVTIASDPESTKATLTIRSAGIVLGADVKFQNVKIELANSYNNALFANGHKLTLENVERSRDIDNLVHIFAGSVYRLEEKIFGIESVLVHQDAQPGNKAVINISGKSTLGNIYAGSINGSYIGDVDITVTGQSGSVAGAVYGAGAVTSVVPNMFEGTKPEPPASNYLKYPVNGKVSIVLNNSKVKTLDGRTNINGNLSDVTISNDYLSENNNFTGIDTLTINKGKFAFNNTGNMSYIAKSLNLKNGTTLDASNWNEISLAGDLAGDGGKLVLNKDGKATFNGNFTGNIQFATPSSNDRSGLVNNNHTYIQVNGNNAGAVSFIPYDSDSQSKIKLVKNGNVWQTTTEGNAGAVKTNTQTEVEISGLKADNSVDYGNNLTISINVIYNSGAGLVDKSDAVVECYINGKKNNVTKNTVIKVTKENGFKVGENDITAVYAGDNLYEASTQTYKFTVNGLTPTINYSEKIQDNNYVVDAEVIGANGGTAFGNLQLAIGNTVNYENELVNGKTTFTITDI